MSSGPTTDEHSGNQPALDIGKWERNYSMCMYILVPLVCVACGWLAAMTTLRILFLGFPLMALFLWLNGRGESAFVDSHGREVVKIACAMFLIPIPSLLGSDFLFLAVVAGTALVGLFCFVCGAVDAARGCLYRVPVPWLRRA